MFSRKKTVTRHRTATIAMVTVLVVTLIAYFFSERVLRQAMLRPIKRENVDFAKVLDWLPPKAKAELEYRARYLDLRQKYDQAETKEEKLRTAYALAIHTRDQKEHNQLMLQFIDNPAYAGMKNLYQPYVRMLYDPRYPFRNIMIFSEPSRIRNSSFLHGGMRGTVWANSDCGICTSSIPTFFFRCWKNPGNRS